MDVLEFFWKKNSKCVCVDINTIWTGDRTVSNCPHWPWIMDKSFFSGFLDEHFLGALGRA